VNEQNMMSAQEPLTEAGEELDTVDIGKQLERVKLFLWHGNVGRVLDTIEDIEDRLQGCSRTLLRAHFVHVFPVPYPIPFTFSA